MHEGPAFLGMRGWLDNENEIARRVCVEGQSLEAELRETGCGHLCTACLPDLRDHLAARR